MSKPDINPSNYMQAKYSAALASYLGKANLSAANICDKIDSYILEQITAASIDDMCILLYPEQAADRLVNLAGYSISYRNMIYKHILYYMLARMSALNWVVKINDREYTEPPVLQCMPFNEKDLQRIDDADVIPFHRPVAEGNQPVSLPTAQAFTMTTQLQRLGNLINRPSLPRSILKQNLDDYIYRTIKAQQTSRNSFLPMVSLYPQHVISQLCISADQIKYREIYQTIMRYFYAYMTDIGWSPMVINTSTDDLHILACANGTQAINAWEAINDSF